MLNLKLICFVKNPASRKLDPPLNPEYSTRLLEVATIHHRSRPLIISLNIAVAFCICVQSLKLHEKPRIMRRDESFQFHATDIFG